MAPGSACCGNRCARPLRIRRRRAWSRAPVPLVGPARVSASAPPENAEGRRAARRRRARPAGRRRPPSVVPGAPAPHGGGRPRGGAAIAPSPGSIAERLLVAALRIRLVEERIVALYPKRPDPESGPPLHRPGGGRRRRVCSVLRPADLLFATYRSRWALTWPRAAASGGSSPSSSGRRRAAPAARGGPCTWPRPRSASWAPGHRRQHHPARRRRGAGGGPSGQGPGRDVRVRRRRGGRGR